MFGIAHTPYCHHMSAFLREEKLVDRNDNDVYIPGVDNKGNLEEGVQQRDWVRHLDIPIYLFIGELNQVHRPPGVVRSYQMLKELHPEQDYEYAVIPGYGHLDCLIGKDAATDVWPGILSFLDKYADS